MWAIPLPPCGAEAEKRGGRPQRGRLKPLPLSPGWQAPKTRAAGKNKMGGKHVSIRSGWESHGRNSLPPGGHDGFVVIEDVRRDLREQLWREYFFEKECCNKIVFLQKRTEQPQGRNYENRCGDGFPFDSSLSFIQKIVQPCRSAFFCVRHFGFAGVSASLQTEFFVDFTIRKPWCGIFLDHISNIFCPRVCLGFRGAQNALSFFTRGDQFFYQFNVVWKKNGSFENCRKYTTSKTEPRTQKLRVQKILVIDTGAQHKGEICTLTWGKICAKTGLCMINRDNLRKYKTRANDVFFLEWKYVVPKELSLWLTPSSNSI